MFGRQAFYSWAHVLLGALWFAGLFVLIELMAGWLFDGTFRLSPRVATLGAAAFVGYVGMALLVRRLPSNESERPS